MSKESGFANVKHLEQGVIEVIPHDGVEITYENIQELQQLINSGSIPKRILINCHAQHSYSFDGMIALRGLEGVLALATYSISKRKPSASDILRGNNRETKFPIESFSFKDEAIAWLRSIE
jgi:hypothetical protein